MENFKSRQTPAANHLEKQAGNWGIEGSVAVIGNLSHLGSRWWVDAIPLAVIGESDR